LLLKLPPWAASEQAWLQYSCPSETGQVHFGCAHLFWTASAIGFLPVRYLVLPFFDANVVMQVKARRAYSVASPTAEDFTMPAQ